MPRRRVIGFSLPGEVLTWQCLPLLPQYRSPSSGRLSCSLYQGATTERAMAVWSASASTAAVTSMVRPLGVLFTCTTRRSQARTQQSD